MKVKTSDLIDAALDWAVAKCEGYHWSLNGYFVWNELGHRTKYTKECPPYSTDWSQGGPIIERELVTVMHRSRPGPYPEGQVWNAVILSNNKCGWYGATPLIAAMRCYVASKLGDEIDIPKELT